MHLSRPPFSQSQFTENGFKNPMWCYFVVVFCLVFVTPNIVQYQFNDKSFNKTETYKHSVVLLLFLSALDK